MGCKGPATDYNCPRIQWNDGTNWPIGVGHGCVGCAQPAFWDTMTPFYRTLPSVGGFSVETTAEEFGIGVVAAVAGITAAHAVGSVVKRSTAKGKAEKEQQEQAAKTSQMPLWGFEEKSETTKQEEPSQ
jgi:hydrogenase small subunit